jgi:Domain of unknown function DUF11
MRQVGTIGRGLARQVAGLGLGCLMGFAPMLAQAGASTRPAGICDLAINKRILPDSAADSARVTLTLTIQNLGSGSCGSGPDLVLVQDPAAPGLTFPRQRVRISHPGWQCSITPGGLTCQTSATLSSHYKVSFVLVGQVTGPPGAKFQNCASVGASDDGVPANNTACTTIRVVPTKSGGSR